MSEKINLDNDLNGHLKEIVPFEDQWISEDESFIRLKLDNLKHVKNKFNSMIKLKTKKIKRLDKEQKIEIKKYDTFLSQEYFPFLKFEQFPIDINREPFKLSIKDNQYEVEVKPEIGTNLFFKIEDNGLKYLGKSEEYIEAVKKKSKYPQINKKSTKIAKKNIDNNNNIKEVIDEKFLKDSIDERFRINSDLKKEAKIDGNLKKKRKRKNWKSGTVKHFQKIEKNENNNLNNNH